MGWEFLRNDLPTDTDRFLLGEVQASVFGINDLPMDLVGPSTVVPQTRGGARDVALGHTNTLAIVKSFNGSEFEGVCLEEICKFAE